MDEIDLHQLPPKNIFQRFVVVATIGLAVLSLSPTWLTHIQIPRGNLSNSAIIIIAGIICYWICGYAPILASNGLRKLLGISREIGINKSNIVQSIIKKITAVVFFLYLLGFILGVSDLHEYGLAVLKLIAASWFLWWTAGETPYLLRKMASSSRPTIRAMLFFISVIGSCAYGIFFLINNPYYLFIPEYDFTFENIYTVLRCNIPFVSKC